MEEGSNTDQTFGISSSPARDDRHGVVPTNILPGVPRDEHGRPIFSHDSPRPTRRATVLGRSPEQPGVLDIHVDLTPSKRREKSKSANDLKRLIRPISKVQFELDKRKSPVVYLFICNLSFRVVAAKSSLSAVLDRDLFTPDPVPLDPDTSESSSDHVTPDSPGRNSLTDSPFVVHPYPSRQQTVASPDLDSPTRRDVEGVYDRFLMATSGVKRVGKGYQSCHVRPVAKNVPSPAKSPGRFFHSTRRRMPPPVSSDDMFLMSSSDELGVILSNNANDDGPGLREDRTGTAKVFSRALKALVAGKPAVNKGSRTL